MLKFLKSPPVLAITAIFLVQAGMLYSTVRTEVIPGARSLAEFPKQIGDARFLSEGVIDPAGIRRALRPERTTNGYSAPWL